MLENMEGFVQKTGIEELDGILGGGFPKGAVVLLAGSSGSGKTILSFQWIFEGVKQGEKGVYITLTEPVFKLLENLEKLSYYDREAVERGDVKLIDLREKFPTQGANPKDIINYIAEVVKSLGARRLCIDSITAIAYQYNDRASIRSFIFELGKMLAVLGCTSVLISEVHDVDRFSVYDVEEFISDGIIKLRQRYIKDKLRRTLQIVKMRGVEYKPDIYSFKIDKNGVKLFPMMKTSLSYISSEKKVSIGAAGLDGMCNGGVFEGSSTLVAGPTGSGKTVLSLQFILEGLRNNENCLYVSFEESRDQLLRSARGFGWNLEGYENQGLLTFLCESPENGYLEEHLITIKNIVENKEIKRCVIDSLTAIADVYPEIDFRDFVKKLTNYLKLKNVTNFMISATSTFMGSEVLTDSRLSTLTDNIILLRYIETRGELSRMVAVLKTRGSNMEKTLREYEITSEGIMVGEPISNYEGLMAGSSRKIGKSKAEKIRNGFVKTLGGKEGIYSFEEAIKGGLSQTSMDQYIDSLVFKDQITSEDGRKLKEQVFKILENIDAGE